MKRGRLSLETHSTDFGSSSEQVDDDPVTSCGTPPPMGDIETKHDDQVERSQKRVKPSPLLNFVKVSSGSYDQSHYKSISRDDDFISYLVFSDNKTPTMEIKQAVLLIQATLIVLTVDNRIYNISNFDKPGSTTFQEIDLDIADRSSIVKLSSTSTVAYVLTKTEVFALYSYGRAPDKIGSIVNEEFVDFSVSYVDNILLLTDNNRILTSGWNKYGMLGDGTDKSKYGSLVSPQTTHTSPVKLLLSGSCFTLYTSGESFFACGNLEHIGNPKCANTFERQTHFKFQVSNVEKMASVPSLTCFWTNQQELHIYGRGYYNKINLNYNLCSINLVDNKFFCLHKEGNEITLTRYISEPSFTKEEVIGKSDSKWFNSICGIGSTLMVFYTKPHHEETIFKKVVTCFFDMMISF